MIDPTTSPQLFGGSSTSTSGTSASKATLDKDAFMKLFVAQLSHQDPMNPLQADQLASQLAQFTSVEQLTQLNTSVGNQTLQLQASTLSSQSALSASLMGRFVEAAGDQVTIPSTGKGSILVDVAGNGGVGTLTLTNSTGTVIATRTIGAIKSGTAQSILLPSNLPPGTWKYSLTVKDSKGTESAVTTYSSGVVSGITFKNGEIVLETNGMELSLSNLVRIAATAPTATTTVSTDPPAASPPSKGEGGPLGQPTIPGDGLLTRIASLLTN